MTIEPVSYIASIDKLVPTLHKSERYDRQRFRGETEYFELFAHPQMSGDDIFRALIDRYSTEQEVKKKVDERTEELRREISMLKVLVLKMQIERGIKEDSLKSSDN